MDTEGQAAYRRFVSGDDTAFDEILELYQKSLIFFICGFVHNTAVTEDIAADVFSELILYPSRYNFSVSLKTYLFMLGRSRALDYLRHSSRLRLMPLEDNATDEADYRSLEEELITDEKKRLLNEAILRLKEDYRTAIHLVYFEEMSYEQAAKVMKKTKKQVENLLYRARNALRNDLTEEGDIFEKQR